MILIADSGGTKTDWVVLRDGIKINEIQTPGLHPFFMSSEEMTDVLDKELYPLIEPAQFEQLYFYGAGCYQNNKKEIVEQALESMFTNTSIEIESDLMGAARALFKHGSGIACIMGTGSSSCNFDGRQITDKAPSLGYLLGDEGSGAHVGKQLCKLYLEKKLDEGLIPFFESKFGGLLPDLIMRIYHDPFPNRLLAQISIFAYEYKQYPQMEQLVYTSIETFILNQKNYYKKEKEIDFGFCGSMAYYFKDIIEAIAEKNNILLKEIQKSPMEGLIQYHLQD